MTMFMTRAYKVTQVSVETAGSSSIVSLHETTLWCDHIPDKSELKGYWTPYAWNPIPEPSVFSEYMADVQSNDRSCTVREDQ